MLEYRLHSWVTYRMEANVITPIPHQSEWKEGRESDVASLINLAAREKVDRPAMNDSPGSVVRAPLATVGCGQACLGSLWMMTCRRCWRSTTCQYNTILIRYRHDIELYFDHNHNVIYIQCKYTLTEYNKYIIVTVEILLKPQEAYNEDHQDIRNRH